MKGGRGVPASRRRRPPDLPRWTERHGARGHASQAERGVGRWVVLVAGGLLGVLAAEVWVRLKVTEAGYRMSATRQLVERLERERGDLMVRAAAADTPARLERLGRRLGLRPPEPEEERVLR